MVLRVAGCGATPRRSGAAGTRRSDSRPPRPADARGRFLGTGGSARAVAPQAGGSRAGDFPVTPGLRGARHLLLQADVVERALASCARLPRVRKWGGRLG